MKNERDAMLKEAFGEIPTIEQARAYFFGHHDGKPAMAPLKRPCKSHGKEDCAVLCGLYSPFSALLSLLPPEEIERASLKWYCHNHPNRACAGNIEYQKRINS